MFPVLMALIVAIGFCTEWTPQPEGSSPTVGTWLGEARTEGGLGNWIEFRADGTVRWAFGAIVEGTYRYDGTSLRTKATAKQHETVPVDLRVEGDTAVLQQPPPADAPSREQMSPEERAMFDRMSKPIDMKRIGPLSPGDSPLVGTWTYTHPTGTTAYQTFTRDGYTYLLVLMNAVEGTYMSGADRIVVKLPGENRTLTRTGDVLMAGTMEGRHSTFHRAPK